MKWQRTLAAVNRQTAEYPIFSSSPTSWSIVSGKRVMNEDFMQNATYLSNVADHQKDKTCFSIIDTSIVKYYVKHGVEVTSLVSPNPDVSDFYEGIETILNNGSRNFFRADTIEELAEKAGIDVENLKETIEDYNYFCDSYDQEFLRTRNI